MCIMSLTENVGVLCLLPMCLCMCTYVYMHISGVSNCIHVSLWLIGYLCLLCILDIYVKFCMVDLCVSATGYVNVSSY